MTLWLFFYVSSKFVPLQTRLGEEEDVEVLSYTHATAKPGPFPSADQRSILPEMAPQGQHLETEHNCSKQRENLSDSRIPNGCRKAACGSRHSELTCTFEI